MKRLVLAEKEFILRPWREDDISSLVLYANNYNISRNLRDAFPYPYTLSDAVKWIDMVHQNRTDLIMAIEVNGEAVGGIGIHGMKDVYRYNAELGYWLAEIHWGKGIVTRSVRRLVTYAFDHYRWQRIFAMVFEHNEASMRVLEKNGFRKEAIHRKAVIKEGIWLDEHLYALLKDDWERFVRDNSGKKA
ncbi:MAG: GNAT family N-acetyltransferase [Bacteroidales bacterium]|nr:GNAT family N-acetyltransferase [Bacteroidales bacterium]MBN2699499.1 GNAT family N-acetyltransferase [Bacteroidales bacterium]